jgi:hypothetical protein
LSGAGKKVSVFKYEDNDTQTYLINYPLFEMDLDFNKYINETGINDTSRVPSVVIDQEYADQVKNASNFVPSYLLVEGNLPYNSWVHLQPLTVDLGDMKNLISNIRFKKEGVKFTLQTDSAAKAVQLREAIRIRIPQLNIGSNGFEETNWAKGKVDGNNVVFESTEFDNNPVLLIPGNTTSQTITIDICLANTIDAGTYTTELDFNWSSAWFYPQNTSNGEIDGFDLSSYFSELGSGTARVEFDSVPAYLYVDAPAGINPDIDISISGTGDQDIDLPAKNKFSSTDALALGWLFDESSEIKKYKFESALNNAEKIKYTISMSEVFLENGTTGKFTANLAVLLPMKFKFTPNSGEEIITINGGEYAGDYLPVNIKGLDDFLEGDTSADNVMDQINEQLGGEGVNSLKIRLRDIENEVTSPIYLAMATTIDSTEKQSDGYWKIIPIVSGSTGEIEIVSPESLKKLPEIKFLLKKETDDYTLSIQPQDTDNVAFDVKISVVAGINLDKTLEIN